MDEAFAIARQIASAQKHPRVAYIVAKGEQAPLADRSVELVAIAQALHWLDRPRFYQEVRRVARAGGIVAAWAYGLAVISPEIDRVILRLYRDVLGAYWPPERRMVETAYATIEFPFPELPAPEFAVAGRWNLSELVGYLGTWSSVRKYVERHGSSPLAAVDAGGTPLIVAHSGTYRVLCRLLQLEGPGEAVANCRPVRFVPPARPGGRWSAEPR